MLRCPFHRCHLSYMCICFVACNVYLLYSACAPIRFQLFPMPGTVVIYLFMMLFHEQGDVYNNCMTERRSRCGPLRKLPIATSGVPYTFRLLFCLGRGGHSPEPLTEVRCFATCVRQQACVYRFTNRSLGVSSVVKHRAGARYSTQRFLQNSMDSRFLFTDYCVHMCFDEFGHFLLISAARR